MILTIVCILLTFSALILLNENGSLSVSTQKRLIALVLLVLGIITANLEYGGLRGFIVFLALASLIGTLIPFLQERLSPQSK